MVRGGGGAQCSGRHGYAFCSALACRPFLCAAPATLTLTFPAAPGVSAALMGCPSAWPAKMAAPCARHPMLGRHRQARCSGCASTRRPLHKQLHATNDLFFLFPTALLAGNSILQASQFSCSSLEAGAYKLPFLTACTAWGSNPAGLALSLAIDGVRVKPGCIEVAGVGRHCPAAAALSMLATHCFRYQRFCRTAP